MLQIQYLFVIKLVNILTSKDMFIVCKIQPFIFIALHFILYTHFLHEEKKAK
jgi:hypothetical protein